jgi:hypothetical protein
VAKISAHDGDYSHKLQGFGYLMHWNALQARPLGALTIGKKMQTPVEHPGGTARGENGLAVGSISLASTGRGYQLSDSK